jgi:hypothetical protein
MKFEMERFLLRGEVGTLQRREGQEIPIFMTPENKNMDS